MTPSVQRAWFQVKKRLPIGPEAVIEPDALTHEPVAPSRHSMTAFNGTPQAWNHYLQLPPKQRHRPGWAIQIDWAPGTLNLIFTANTQAAEPVAGMLQAAWPILLTQAKRKPHIDRLLQDLFLNNASNKPGSLSLVISSNLASQSTREVQLNEANPRDEKTLIVFDEGLLSRALKHTAALPGSADDEQRLGVAMLVLQPLIASLAYPNRPRDRFVERIAITRRVYQLTINLLYTERRLGRLIPNQAGETYRKIISQDTGIPIDQLDEADETTHLLQDLAMLLTDHPNPLVDDNASIIVREYLDTRYVRLSVADLLPPLVESKKPMPIQRMGQMTDRPSPQIGRFGIVDKEDLYAWKKVDREFRKQGFPLVRQLGIGQFGRVYEAVNLLNGNLPRRVAIKVDRLTARGHNPIQNPTHAMTHANKLALSPHIIRLYDTGHLSRLGLNFHILQLLDGETLDDLLGITGREHASITAPKAKHNAQDLDKEVRFALSVAHGETWRIRGDQSAFARALKLNQVLDLLTSILLWIEEIHGLGYAINDLKNGNLMLTRTGQLKGIDLDSYAPAFASMHRMVDFKFLAIAITLFLLNAGHDERIVPQLSGGLMNDTPQLKALIKKNWHFADVAQLSNGRVQTSEVLDALAELIVSCNNGDYAEEPGQFTDAVNRFITLKRRIALDEIVLD